MAEQQGDQTQFLLGDFNTRMRDLEERNKLVRERVLLLGKNLIASRSELESELEEVRKQNVVMMRDMERMKKIANSLIAEFGKMIKRDEVMVIERMLKDFQPLEFMRRKDVEALIVEKLSSFSSEKQIKTKKSTV